MTRTERIAAIRRQYAGRIDGEYEARRSADLHGLRHAVPVVIVAGCIGVAAQVAGTARLLTPHTGSVPSVVVVRNEDGSTSSELTITINSSQLNDGRYTVIPTLVEGRKLSTEDAVRFAIRSGLRFPAFDTLEDADQFTMERSKAGGAARLGFLGKPPTRR